MANYVYVIACRDLLCVKFGFAKSPSKRLMQLQTACPAELTLEAFGQFDDAEGVEASIHYALNSFRVRGEWFKTTPIVLELVRLLRDLPQDEFLKKLEGWTNRESERRDIDAGDGLQRWGRDLPTDMHLDKDILVMRRPVRKA